jgi:hypothetical protein
MSRAEELRRAGATILADKSVGERVGATPFVRWPGNTPAWIEGSLTELWEGKYGTNATIIVTGCSEGLTAGGEVTASYPVEEGVGQKFNVGLSSATLKDRVTDEHIGEVLHFEFLGWVEPTNGGNRYRHFEIQVVPEELRRFVVEETVEVPAPQSTEDGLPF